MSPGPEHPHEPRPRIDRRRKPTSPWAGCHPGGRRRELRRESERLEPYFVDLIDPSTFGLAILLLVLTIVDGAVTLVLLGAGCEEVNPAMDYLLRRGPLTFLMGKYILTTASLPFLLIFRHFRLFRTRFRVGYLLPIFVGLYFILLGYQIALMTNPQPWPEPISETRANPCPMFRLPENARICWDVQVGGSEERTPGEPTTFGGDPFDLDKSGVCHDQRNAGSLRRVPGRELREPRSA